MFAAFGHVLFLLRQYGNRVSSYHINLVEYEWCISDHIFLPVLSVCLSVSLPACLSYCLEHGIHLAWPGLPGKNPTYTTYLHFLFSHSLTHSLHSSSFFTLSSSTLTYSLAFSHRSLDPSHFSSSASHPHPHRHPLSHDRITTSTGTGVILCPKR